MMQATVGVGFGFVLHAPGVPPLPMSARVTAEKSAGTVAAVPYGKVFWYCRTPVDSVLRLLTIALSCELRTACIRLGIALAARTSSIEITISNSISEKPFWFLLRIESSNWI